MQTYYPGVDYGNGVTNIDTESGIRYGVIPQHEVGDLWYEESEMECDYPTCPYCEEEALLYDDLPMGIQEIVDEEYEYDGTAFEYVCHICKRVFSAGDSFIPTYFSYEEDGYCAVQNEDDTDIFILKSPYFTYAQFCSPCAPGAIYITNSLQNKMENNRGYCFGPEWFEGGTAPYTIYSVETGEEICN